jgi:hypothetical protein
MLTVMVVLALMLVVFVCCVGGGAAVMVDLAVAATVRVVVLYLGYSALHLPSIYGGSQISSGAILNFSQYIYCGDFVACFVLIFEMVCRRW